MTHLKTYTVRGKTGTILELAAYFGVPGRIATQRVFQHGWGVDRAVTEPVRKRSAAKGISQ